MNVVTVGLLASACLLRVGAIDGDDTPKRPRESVLIRGGAVIIRHPLIQKELDVTPRQLKRIQPHVERCLETLENRPQPVEGEFVDPDKEGGSDFEAQAKLLEQIRRSLTRPQFQRFEQLILQAQGPRVFENPNVQKALQLSGDQNSKVHGVLDAMVGDEMSRDTSKMVKEEIYLAKIAREERAHQEILAVLTESQKRTWIEMVGKTFSPLLGRATAMNLELLRQAKRKHGPP